MSGERKEMGKLDKAFKDCFTLIQATIPLNDKRYPRIDTAIEILYRQVSQLIQQKPEVDDMEGYVERKARELIVMGLVSAEEIDSEFFEAITTEDAKDFITQIIRDVKSK